MNNTTDLDKLPFNEDFRNYLEWHLTATFRKSNDPQIKKLWCDGVLPPFNDNELSTKNIHDSRKIQTEAFIGIDGQDKYQMTIRLGNHSLRRLAKGFSLKDCIPEGSSSDWLTIDVEKRIIELQLN